MVQYEDDHGEVLPYTSSKNENFSGDQGRQSLCYLLRCAECCKKWSDLEIGEGNTSYISINYQQYALILPLLYSVYWILHVSAVTCHHHGDS
jgi:hypothetical protein